VCNFIRKTRYLSKTNVSYISRGKVQKIRKRGVREDSSKLSVSCMAPVLYNGNTLMDIPNIEKN
jgi:hypothetical protein